MEGYNTDSDYEDEKEEVIDEGIEYKLPNQSGSTGAMGATGAIGSTGQSNQSGQSNQANLNEKKSEDLDVKKKEFDGSQSSKNGWTKCFYCDKYHPKSMHLPGMQYCGHCWGWLNGDQLNLTTSVYSGSPNTIVEVLNFLKLTYPLHPSTCTNTDCIYNKITVGKNNGTLHWDLSVQLGFIKKEELEKKIPHTNTTKTNLNAQNKIYNKGNGLRINFNSSSVSI